jgi:hypothetical protein
VAAQFRPGDRVVVAEPGGPERRGVVVLPPDHDGAVLVRYDPPGQVPGDPPQDWHHAAHLARLPEPPPRRRRDPSDPHPAAEGQP